MTDLVDAARDALRQVFDPEAGLNIIDLGLVYDIRASNGDVDVVMTFTTPACPAGPMLVASAEQALRAIPGVDAARVEVTFEPFWTPDMITPDGRALLGW